jgi:hypothetical protein
MRPGVVIKAGVLTLESKWHTTRTGLFRYVAYRYEPPNMNYINLLLGHVVRRNCQNANIYLGKLMVRDQSVRYAAYQ